MTIRLPGRLYIFLSAKMESHFNGRYRKFALMVSYAKYPKFQVLP